MYTFSVLDVETTGFFPGMNDRIIEIAIINLDSDGEIISQYETLINPDRDLGPTNIHKISAEMLHAAPRFEEVMGDIIENIKGNIVVGHNVEFDLKFLKHEYLKQGVTIPDPSRICTISFSRKVDPSIPCRKLPFLCEYFNIPINNHHSAYFDSFHTSKLFTTLLREYGIHNLSAILKISNDSTFWPSIPRSNKCFKRSNFNQYVKENNFISRIISRLPDAENNDDGVIEYLNLLDEILDDRKITLEEAEAIYELAVDYDISRSQAVEIHQRYLSNMVRVALLDGIITESETKDLKLVARILNISEKDLEQIINQEKVNIEKTREVDIEIDKEMNLAGKSVCFTGTLNSHFMGKPLTRELAHKLAIEHGLVIKKGVTKDLDYLVIADPHSMSSKAKKARTYNTKILAEQVFWTMLGIQIS